MSLLPTKTIKRKQDMRTTSSNSKSCGNLLTFWRTNNNNKTMKSHHSIPHSLESFTDDDDDLPSCQLLVSSRDSYSSG